jgi:hypothetical protein
MEPKFLAGVVEGFYGRSWSWELRRDYAAFLKRLGLNCYLYCPKSDAYLRKRWRESWPPETWRRLSALSSTYRSLGLYWGVGISPFALYLDYSSAARAALKSRIGEINELEGGMLAVLFDDMPGECPDIAARQAEIIADIRRWSDAERLLVCPTYYSFDPVLERFFGRRPEDYWVKLGELLPVEVDMLWTGNEVCSQSVARSDILDIAELMGRPPLLWDNYPVNDGQKACEFLHLAPLANREPGLGSALRGHLCNPMNQGYLSRFPLTGLATLYGAAPAAMEDVFSKELAAMLAEDIDTFQRIGLAGMGDARREQLLYRYQSVDDPGGREVAAWLRGEYAFDPACLTG